MSHSADSPPARPRRTWPWIVAVLVAVIAIVAGASITSSLLAADDAPIPPQTIPTATPTVSSSTPTASLTPSATSAPRPELDGDDRDAVERAIDEESFADLYDFLAESVRVTIAASDFDQERSRDNAIIDLEYLDDSGDWDWNLDDETITAFQSGPYAQHFGSGTIAGRSTGDYVLSFEVERGLIVAVFLSNSSSVVSG